MLRINLPDYLHYSAELFLEFLEIHSQTHIRISFPRLFCLEEDPCFPASVLQEYYKIGCVTEKIARVCNRLSYNVPDPRDAEPVIVEIVSTDFKGLADALRYALSGIYDEDSELYIPIKDDACAFFLRASNGEIGSCVWGLLAVAEFLIDSNEDMDVAE